MLSGNNMDAKYIDPSNANNYRNNNDIQFNQAKDFIDANGELIKGPILDIGSGDGKVTAYIAKKFGEPIVGIDISAERVALANSTYRTDQLHFVVGNAVKLDSNSDVSSKQYGTILSFNTLHHIPKNMQSSVFSQTKKLLRDDGVALFLIPGRSPELHDAISETALSEKWKRHFTEFDISQVRTYETADYYKSLCMKTGFYDCTVTSANEDGGKELDKEGMKSFLSGWLPHLAHLKSKNVDDNLQNQFLDDIVSLYFIKMNKCNTGKVTPKITQNRLIAYASANSFFGGKKLLETKTSLGGHNTEPKKQMMRAV